MSQPQGKPRQSFIHTRTFFQGDRWGAHDHMGVLMARGVTQISVVKDGADWNVSWVEVEPPDVIKAAEDTPA